jgi:hypothetical protein
VTDSTRHRHELEISIPQHWSGEQALLVCDFLLALHDAICDRYRPRMLEALGEPLPGSDPFRDDDLPF